MFFLFNNYEKKIAKILMLNKMTLSTAESCTGGLISSLLTDISGSSNFIKSNFVTYSNEAKQKYLNVRHDTLEKYGAVSEQTAKEMAEGLIVQTGADFAIGITGIAGPTGGSKEKPVGLSYVGISDGKNTVVEKLLMPKWFSRKFMKFCFAKKALYYFFKYMKGL